MSEKTMVMIDGNTAAGLGCVFGGALTALRYPERTLMAVPALKTYYEPLRPLTLTVAGELSMQQQVDELLDLADFDGLILLETQAPPAKAHAPAGDGEQP